MIDSREQKIIDFVSQAGVCSSKEINDNVDISVSYATLKRILSKLIMDGYLTNVSQGKGTKYCTSDNEFQLSEALKNSCDVINSKNSVFEKALLALVLISYIHPFMDGNKRTARIESNAILMNEKHCPLSFRTVNSLATRRQCYCFMSRIMFPNSKRFLSINLNLPSRHTFRKKRDTIE